MSAGLRSTTLLLVLLCLALFVPGLVGHDPWKQDETYVFGIIYHMLQSGDWVVPTLAGEPFMEKPPLYYLTASLFAHTFSPWLPLHDAARLASGFFMLLTLLSAGLAGRELWGRGQGAPTVLLLMGCVGLLRASHEMINDVPLLAGYSMAFYGLALSRRRWAPAALLIGTGVGIGFLSKGLLVPGFIGLTALLLPLLAPHWRTRRYAGCLAAALLVALPWLLIWPIALYRRSPELFNQWLWLNNLGRFLGVARLGAEKTEPWYWLHVLPWQSWPAWLFAALTLWRARGTERWNHPALRLSLLAAVVIVVVLNVAGVARDLYALSLLLPLAVLGAPAVQHLPPRVDAAFSAFSVVCFGLLAAAVWAVWTMMLVQGAPPQLALLAKYLPMDYHPDFRLLPFLVAALYTLLWLAALVALRRSAWRAAGAWVLGITLVWGLLTTIWLPWIDTAKSYRGMIGSLRQALPARYDCIASRRLGESQRGMLDYFAGIVTRRIETDPGASCELLLIESDDDAPPIDPGPGWHLIWQGARPGDTKEHHRLYRRTG